MEKGKANQWVVLKFGGTSVASLECWQAIRVVVEKRINAGLRPVVVCSALSGISDMLERLIEKAVSGSHQKTLDIINDKHRELADQLGVDFGVADCYLEELVDLANGISLTGEATPRVRAQVLALGELILTSLGAEFLNNKGPSVEWRDARELLIAKDAAGSPPEKKFLAALCEFERDEDLDFRLPSKPPAGRRGNDNNQAILTQGFIAGDKSGETVLLGRGGSDVSAAYFAAKLGASRCEVWTDVPGLFTANPHRIPTARLLTALDYDEALEIASSGGKVLHPRSLAPLKKNGIPLHIYSLAHPGLEGTVISVDAEKKNAQVKAISARPGITLISMDTVDMWHQAGFLADVFDAFKDHGISVDLISTSETNLTVTLDDTLDSLDQAVFNDLISRLETFCGVRVVSDCAFVSIVGRNIRSILHRLAPALEIFNEHRVYMISQAANDLSFTFVVDEDQAERLVKKLHKQLFQEEVESALFGPTWQDIFAGRKKEEPQRTAWWQAKKDVLIGLAKKESPLYVYDEEMLQKRLEDLKGIKSADRIFYSIKANSNPGVLKSVYDAGFGFECVSQGELEWVAELFPGIGPSGILFTPNFAARSEYSRAFELGAMVTLDNIYPLREWQEVFKGKDILVRVDPGAGQGHHKYVKTAGSKSKFGISLSELGELKNLAGECGARITGLHAHVGSNVFTTDTWSDTALFFTEVAKDFPDVSILDLGGGLGVVEKAGRRELDLSQVDENIKRVKKEFPQFEIWIEPGRYVVAECGVLLARVTQTKKKGDYNYVGLNVGMNTLIRPALYGAHHDIFNLSRLDEKPEFVANIVGPICETGDVLGYERRIALPREGDIFLIATAGAYGRVMSSQYNLRNPAAEYFLSI